MPVRSPRRGFALWRMLIVLNGALLAYTAVAQALLVLHVRRAQTRAQSGLQRDAELALDWLQRDTARVVAARRAGLPAAVEPLSADAMVLLATAAPRTGQTLTPVLPRNPLLGAATPPLAQPAEPPAEVAGPEPGWVGYHFVPQGGGRWAPGALYRRHCAGSAPGARETAGAHARFPACNARLDTGWLIVARNVLVGEAQSRFTFLDARGAALEGQGVGVGAVEVLLEMRRAVSGTSREAVWRARQRMQVGI